MIKSGTVQKTRTEITNDMFIYTITIQSDDGTYEYIDRERTTEELIQLCKILDIKYMHQISGINIDFKFENDVIIAVGSQAKDEWVYNTN